MNQEPVARDCPRCGADLIPMRFSSGAEGYHCANCGARFKRRRLDENRVRNPEQWRNEEIIVEPKTRQEVTGAWGGILTGDEEPGETIRCAQTPASDSTERIAPKSDTLSRILKLPGYNLTPREKPDIDQPKQLEILSEIGEGGMGKVYLAKQHNLDREVAIKTISGDAADNLAMVNMFLSEAVAMGMLEHPNIMPIHELGVDTDGYVFYSMKHIKGISWSELLAIPNGETGPDGKVWDIRAHLDVLLKVCDAIAFAHSRGIIHRDLKPDNVMVGAFGEVIVLDWSLAVAYENVESSATRKISSSRHAQGLCGTPTYMPPEMAAGDALSICPASDVYLLGGLLFRVLYGRAPHNAATTLEIIVAAAQNKLDFPKTVPSSALPFIHAFEDTLMTALEADPADRFDTAQDFLDALHGNLRHLESTVLADDARELLKKLASRARHGARAAAKSMYPEYTKAITLLEQSLKI